MTTIFKSPQTGNNYVKVTIDERMFVGVRLVKEEGDDQFYRITIRGEYEDLVEVQKVLKYPEGIKDDHISVIAKNNADRDAKLERAFDVVRDVIGYVTFNHSWADQVQDVEHLTVSVECPLCGVVIAI